MNKLNINKDLLRELATYDFCPKELIEVKDVSRYKNEKDKYVLSNTYLCEMDDLVNTRILLGIFKCVNFMKNVLVAGLICGGIGVLILAISLMSK